MARTKANATPKATAFTGVPRPSLTVAQQALAAQHRPPRCTCTAYVNPDQMAYVPEWLMETPQEGQALQYYCSNCGRYVSVPLA